MTARFGACAAVVIMLFTSGCVADAPVTQAPELKPALSRIDKALSEQQYATARRELRELIDITDAARDRGSLDDRRADRILAAAARLLVTVPRGPRPAGATEAPPVDMPAGESAGNEESSEGDGDD